MAEIPFGSERRAANNRLDAHATRFSSADGGNINRSVSQLLFFFRQIGFQGPAWDVLGHEPSPTAPDAQFYDNSASGLPPVTAETGYILAAPTAGAPNEGPTHRVPVKMLVASVDPRYFAMDQLGEFFPEEPFQKDGKTKAMWSLWERTMILGDASVSGAEFDGLKALANTPGNGQSIAFDTALPDPLSNIDDAIAKVFTHNGRCDVLVMNNAAQRAIQELERARGYKPDWRPCAALAGELTLYYNGIPTCRSDHVEIEAGDVTRIYALSLGRPNGVFAITSEKKPGVWFEVTRREDSPFISVQARMYAALVSTTDDALIELTGFPVRPLP